MELSDFFPWTLQDPLHPVEHLPVEVRMAIGATAREGHPLSAIGHPIPREGRPDPVAVLEAQGVDRVQELLPIRYGRMSANPFATLRGSAASMASDLGRRSSSALTVQLCGDAHLSNFGLFATPERELLFDVNDFDETYPGPFEWDVIRLAASAAVLARVRKFGEAVAKEAAREAARAYRERMHTMAAWNSLDIWYDKIDEEVVDRLATPLGAKYVKRADAAFEKARTRTMAQAAEKFTSVVDGHRRFVESPPLLERPDMSPAQVDSLAAAMRSYRASLLGDRSVLLQRYRIVDFARKVVGVGSVGMRAWVIALEGRDSNDVLILQAKEAVDSVLAKNVSLPDHVRPVYKEQGYRVIHGQRVMQAASDLFLGWAPGPFDVDRQYYIRQLRDMKGSLDPDTVRPKGLVPYIGLCGYTLARAHARGGDAVALASYIGETDDFDKAVEAAALDYADITIEDHAALAAAIKSGRIPAQTGI